MSTYRIGKVMGVGERLDCWSEPAEFSCVCIDRDDHEAAIQVCGEKEQVMAEALAIVAALNGKAKP